MKTETETAIKVLMKNATEAKTGAEAMQFTQAALNLAHVEATRVGSEHLEKQGK